MKQLVFIAFLLFSIPGWAQNRVPVLFQLTDGSELSGYLKPFYHGAKTFEYSDEPKGQLNKMKLELVKRMITTEEGRTYVYEVVHLLNSKTDKKENTLLLQLMVEGHMNLYYYNGEFPCYYIKPNPEAKGAYFATLTYLPNTTKRYPKQEIRINKSFTKNTTAFFQDHPEISKEFAEGKADFLKIHDLVRRYNTYKAGQ
ncbi:MAG: hypothetical protein Q8J69_01030 [Sphingobacteriaceae bacterium]|nr:hypothetical protein [Sphingobacteriaceae bacterium]